MAVPTRAKRKLGAFLADLRNRAGFSAEEAAKELITSRPTVTRYESGGVMPVWASVAMLLRFYDTGGDDIAKAKVLWEQAHDEPAPVRLPAGTPKPYRKLITSEAEARSERIVAPTVVEGLLQTKQYARALMTSGRHFRTSEAQTDSAVNVRLNRQKRLVGRDPLQLTVLLDQVAIVRQVGGSDVMREQLTYLLDMSTRASITLQIIPFSGGSYGTMNGAYTIVDYPDPDDSPNVYLEYPAGGAWLENEADVQKFVATFTDVSELALSPDDTAELIRQQIEALE
ncbi:MAG TPA: helix-turn-helix transcriptional regulator [Pseudonocardiaceae bacterium]|nr:helix-turn-helix transcriptional regulator [Pseudonocardiaceae bacterium]